jgi:hypothetical protein
MTDDELDREVDAAADAVLAATEGPGGLRRLATWGGRAPVAARRRVAALVDAVAARVVERPLDLRDGDDTVRRLEAARRRRGTGTSMAGYLAGRGLARRTVRVGARRVPAVMLVTGATAVGSSVSLGARELTILGSRLVQRARAAGLDPTPRWVRYVLVQVYLRPEHRPTLDPAPRWLTSRLLGAWAGRALAGSVPVVPASVALPRPREWVDAVERLDLHGLAAHPDGPPRGDE